MGEHRRKADGRRVFSTEFKRDAVQRILTGEKTLAELSRELDIAPSVIRNWKRFADAGATTARPASRQLRTADPMVLEQIRAVTNSRATYGYRRVWAMVNRTFRAGYNRKRIRRVMQLHGLMLTPRVHRRHGRPHLGRIQQPASNQRWCSDVFLLPCWSGEVISVAFAIDCHDREVSGLRRVAAAADGRRQSHADGPTLWARFGEATLKAPHAVQWLSDNGPQYTATATVLYA